MKGGSGLCLLLTNTLGADPDAFPSLDTAAGRFELLAKRLPREVPPPARGRWGGWARPRPGVSPRLGPAGRSRLPCAAGGPVCRPRAPRGREGPHRFDAMSLFAGRAGLARPPPRAPEARAASRASRATPAPRGAARAPRGAGTKAGDLQFVGRRGLLARSSSSHRLGARPARPFRSARVLTPAPRGGTKAGDLQFVALEY